MITKITPLRILLEDEGDTIEFGRCLASGLSAPFVLYLSGDLGAGKTTMSRGIIQNMGHDGVVKSPTYTLVEPYELAAASVYHFDLYRLRDPEELEFMGVRDYFHSKSIAIIEWPANGLGMLPEADLHLHISYVGSAREIQIKTKSSKGEALLGCIK